MKIVVSIMLISSCMLFSMQIHFPVAVSQDERLPSCTELTLHVFKNTALAQKPDLAKILYGCHCRQSHAFAVADLWYIFHFLPKEGKWLRRRTQLAFEIGERLEQNVHPETAVWYLWVARSSFPDLQLSAYTKLTDIYTEALAQAQLEGHQEKYAYYTKLHTTSLQGKEVCQERVERLGEGSKAF